MSAYCRELEFIVSVDSVVIVLLAISLLAAAFHASSLRRKSAPVEREEREP